MPYKIYFPELTPDYIEEAYAFLASSHIRPLYPRALLNRFFFELASSPENIVEIHDENRKIAAAVLIDKISNIHNSASIELLGFNRSSDSEVILSMLIHHYEKQLIKSKLHAAVTMGYHSSLPFEVTTLEKLGFVPFYEMYDLISTAPKKLSTTIPAPFVLTELSLEKFEEYYDVLCKSFAENPDTSIGPMELMKEGFKKIQHPIFIVSINGRIAGFITLLFENNTGEVNTLGVLPEYRKSGIGKYLLTNGLDYLWSKGAHSIKLSV
ncbi:MAG: GNAT family N-acetyltransferase, partial [Rhizobacter sp.]|nr:GNAT family N-acetyltransferase [Bacteriovorax sp.]